MRFKATVALLLCIFMHHVQSNDILDQLINILKKHAEATASTATVVDVNEQETVEEPDAEPLDEIELLRQARLLKHIERVEAKLEEIKRYIAQEASVDAALESLDNKLSHDFKMISDAVYQRTQSAKKTSTRKADKVKTTLSTVDKYARSRNKDVAGAIYHGGIGSVCTTGSDECRLPDSGCHDEVCQCDPGLSYDALKIRCVDTCRNYGDTYQIVPNYILRGFNTLVVNETSIEECKEACQDSKDFVCRAIEYFPRWHECYLSDLVKSDEMDEAWEYNNAGSHYQRDCAYF